MVRHRQRPLARHLPHVIHRVPTHLVVDLWPAIERQAARAMEIHPFMDERDLLVTILNGYAQLFIVTSERGVLGFAAMEVLTYPSRKVANVLAAGGERGFLSVLIRDLLPELEKWAKEQDADTFAVMGRPGWLKYAKREGAQSLSTVTSWKRLGDVRRRRSAQQANSSI